MGWISFCKRGVFFFVFQILFFVWKLTLIGFILFSLLLNIAAYILLKVISKFLFEWRNAQILPRLNSRILEFESIIFANRLFSELFMNQPTLPSESVKLNESLLNRPSPQHMLTQLCVVDIIKFSGAAVNNKTISIPPPCGATTQRLAIRVTLGVRGERGRGMWAKVQHSPPSGSCVQRYTVVFKTWPNNVC